ncbi:MAG: VOC family protein [Hyphomicrobiales bacterium]
MKGINHLVLAGHDLGELRDLYADLGFTLTPAAQHPFGTGNTVIQLPGSYLELLAVTRPADIVEASPGRYSFSAFNRDYLKRHEGFSMLVLDTPDAAADIRSWKAEGLPSYEPFGFSRKAALPSGEEITIGFALAYTSIPEAPWLGVFCCQHFAPEYYAQPRYLAHRNGAKGLRDVWVTGRGALDLGRFFVTVADSRATKVSAGRIDVPTKYGTIVLAAPEVFEAAFGEPPPHPDDGPHLAAFTVACAPAGTFDRGRLKTVGDRLVLPSVSGFGTVIALSPA